MNHDWLEKIEQYLDGNMSPEEESQFTSELKTNKELAGIFDLYRVLEKTRVREPEVPQTETNREHEEALKRELKKMSAIYSPPEELLEAVKKTAPAGPAKLIRFTRTVAVAASLLGIIVISVVWWYSRDNKEVTIVAVDRANQDSLYAASFEIDYEVPEGVDRLQGALKHLRESSYEEAIASIDKIDLAAKGRGNEDKERTVIYMHYFKAQSYMALDSFEKAIPELEMAKSLLMKEDSVYQYDRSAHEINKKDSYSLKESERTKQKPIPGIPPEQSIPGLEEDKSHDLLLQSKINWYLSLAYLKTGRSKEAEELLQHLAGDEKAGTYRQKALDLISGLKMK